MEEKKKSYSKKKKLALILLAITLVLASVGTFFYTAFAKDRPYKKSGSCTIKVGDATLPISVAFSGTENEFKTNGDIDKKRAFTKSSHTVRVSEGSITQGTAVSNLTVLNSKGKAANYVDCGTVPDSSGDRYNTVLFNISFTLKAHYSLSGSVKTGGSATGGFFGFVSGTSRKKSVTVNGEKLAPYEIIYDFSTNAGHKTANRKITLLVRLNLSQARMLSTSEGNYYNATLTTNSSIIKYTYELKDDLISSNAVKRSDNCGTVETLPKPTLTGYKFNGWTDENDNKLYAGGTKFTVCSKNRTFTASWTAYTHNVVYNLQGGHFPSSKKSQTTLNGCVIVPNGTYYIQSGLTGGRYIHVYNKKMEKSIDPIVIWNGCGGSQTKWIFERYKDTQYYYITSYLNGLALDLSGSPSSSNKLTSKSVELWEQTQPADDYLWYLKDAGNGKVNIYNKSSGQVLDVKGGQSQDRDGTFLQQYNYNSNTNAQKFKLISIEQKDYPNRMQYGNHNIYVNTTIPEKDNSTFFYWNTKPDGTGKVYKAGNIYQATQNGGTVTLYAIWNIDDFTVSFNSNGGTGSIASITHKGFESFTLPTNTFTRKGYVFRGWSLEKYPDKASYRDGDIYDNQTPNAMLYAQWQRKIGGFIQRPFLDSQMFYKDSALIGENGTTYNGDLIDSRMAHIDENGNPGYFSNGWNK